MVEMDPDARITVFDYVELKQYIASLSAPFPVTKPPQL
jgi:hypothetical protein